ncbi:unnamed protein product [Linum trigynum]|uniref:Cysteine-rich transmembrane CYSTM domain-containing protein n=1 Tax=Linum trigynum TaxID=586398 RepID=A0AAV2CFK1_9ROSI
MSYHQHIAHESYQQPGPPPPYTQNDPFPGPPPPSVYPQNEPFPGPPPPPQRGYQRYFDDSRPSLAPPFPHAAPAWHQDHYRRYDDLGCFSCIRACLAMLCCCCLLEQCCP